jgi:hypothetical protein
MDIQLEEMEAVNPWMWAYNNGINLDGEVFQLKGHAYLKDFMTSDAKHKVVRKATQGGFTLATILCVLHMLIHGLGKPIRGILYLFPTADEVYGFSQSRFAPLIRGNTCISKHISAKSVNNAMLKRVGGSNLFFAGGRSTQSVKGQAKESAALRSKPIDLIVMDEKDLMDEDIDLFAESRMEHSWLKGILELSNPTIPNFGISKAFDESDRRHWGYRCGCGAWTIPLLDFETCVHVDKEGKGYVACKKCDRKLEIDEGQWVKPYGGDSEIAGWAWSHFENSFADPAEVIRRLEAAADGTEKQKIYNYKFGLPYIPIEDRLVPQDVIDCCGSDPIQTSSAGPCAMGVDVGNIIHAVIGKNLGGSKHRIIWMGQLKDFTELHDVAARFGVESAVVDIGPEGHSVRAFQKQEPYVVFSCRYQDRAKTVENLDSDAGMIVVDKTSIFDQSRDFFVKKRVELPRRSPSVDEYVRQVCNAVRVREELNDGMVARTHKSWVFRYRSVPPNDDHYRSATNYFMLACKYVRRADLEPVLSRKKRRNEYTQEIAFN